MNDKQVSYDYLTVDKDVKNLVKWDNPPTVMDLKKDLSEASLSHKKAKERIDKWIDALKGKLNCNPAEGRSRVQPKVIRKQNEWRYSSLEEPFLSTPDMFIVNPVTYADVESARQNMMILNKQFRVDIPKTQFINKYIRTGVNTGTIINKLSWETVIDVVIEEVETPVFSQTPEETAMFLQQAVENGEITEEEAYAIFESGESIQIGIEMVPTEMEKEIINCPVIQIKDYNNVIIDPSCEGDIDKAQFIIDRFLTDLSTLKKDGRYSNLELIEERNTSPSITDYVSDNTMTKDPNFEFQDKPRKKLVAYEYWGYWDINKDGIVKPIVATWIGDTMIRLEENPYPDKKIPFVIVQYLPPIDNDVYGDADASLLIDNQNIIGAVTRSMIDLLGRTANGQQGIRKDLLDPINEKKFRSGLDFLFNPTNGSVQDALLITKTPEIPRSALEMVQVQSNDAESMTGVKAFSGGITGNALGNSVGGINSALDSAAKRELGILRRLSDGLIEIGRKIMAMNSVWLSDEEIIRITDDEFVAIPRSDLAGNFDLSLDVSTAEANNQKAQELAFMLQTTGQTMPIEFTQMILSKIAELRKLPDLAKAFKDYQPQPDPYTEQIKELQIQLLTAQIENEHAKAAENRMDEVLKGARAENELSKAGKTASEVDKVKAETAKIRSESDKLDLDFVEQSTGITHGRNLQSQVLGKTLKEQNHPDIGISDFSVDLSE